jgi:hypothetical protein
MFGIYHLFIFTDWVTTISAKSAYYGGYSQCIVLGLMIIYGIFRMVRQSVNALKNKWRQNRYNKMMALSLQRKQALIIEQAELEAIQAELM